LMLAYGNSFTGNAQVLMLLAASAVLNSATAPYSAAITSSGRMWALSLAFAAWGTAFLTASYVLVPSLHATALAAAFVIADGVQAVAVWTVYQRSERGLLEESLLSAPALTDAKYGCRALRLAVPSTKDAKTFRPRN
jgi:O-antigen/teichoic acid export membrane protein